MFWFHLCSPGPLKGIPGDHHTPIIRADCYIGTRVGNFRQKNYSTEDRIDETIGLFWRNSGCSAEQKILGIPFQTILQRRKMLGILYHGTKLEANARNSETIPRKRKQLGIPFHGTKKISKHLEFCSKPFRERDNNSEFRSEGMSEKMLSILFAGAVFFVKLIFFMPFPSVPSFGID